MSDRKLKSKLTLKRAREIAALHTFRIADSTLCKNPRLSVIVCCYNQAKYIEQALDSIYQQETDFEFEVIIGDDGSNDGTAEIVEEYQRRFPTQTILLLAKENLGKHTGNGRINFVRCDDLCRGEYIARLEGDDYWTNKHKLQRQINLLDGNVRLSFCHHRVNFVDEQNEVIRTSTFPFQQNTIELSDLYTVPTNPVFTGSLCYRKKYFNTIPDGYMTLGMLDWPMTFSLLSRGSGEFIEETMSNYRVHDEGIWSKKSLLFRSWQKLRAMKTVIRTLELEKSAGQEQLLFELRFGVARGLTLDRQSQRVNAYKRALFRRYPAKVIRSKTMRILLKLRNLKNGWGSKF